MRRSVWKAYSSWKHHKKVMTQLHNLHPIQDYEQRVIEHERLNKIFNSPEVKELEKMMYEDRNIDLYDDSGVLNNPPKEYKPGERGYEQ